MNSAPTLRARYDKSRLLTLHTRSYALQARCDPAARERTPGYFRLQNEVSFPECRRGIGTLSPIDPCCVNLLPNDTLVGRVLSLGDDLLLERVSRDPLRGGNEL
jgi:hypothetical protein